MRFYGDFRAAVTVNCQNFAPIYDTQGRLGRSEICKKDRS
jgi:hypothetical protein